MTYSSSSRGDIRVRKIHELQSLTNFTPINTQQSESASDVDQRNSVYQALSSTIKMTPDQIKELIGNDILTEENSRSDAILEDLIRYDILDLIDTQSTQQSLTSVLNEAYVESAYRKRIKNRNRKATVAIILTGLTIPLEIF